MTILTPFAKVFEARFLNRRKTELSYLRKPVHLMHLDKFYYFAATHLLIPLKMPHTPRKYESLPVYQKSQELFDLVDVISETMKEDDMKESLAQQMCSNAALIQAKIAGAEGGGLYSLRMQNAVLIKLAVQDMFNAVSFASMVNINEEDYVQLMRDKIEEFREVFVAWIRGFDKAYDIPDNWGIRFDTSTPEQEKLEELMFDDEKFFEDFEEDEFGDDENTFGNENGDDEDDDADNPDPDKK